MKHDLLKADSYSSKLASKPEGLPTCNPEGENNCMADQKKCAHPACTCMTDKKYCSTYCENHKDTAEIACDCGHPGCKGEVNK